MIAYSNIGSKVWTSVTSTGDISLPQTREQIGYLDYQVLDWYASIPDLLRYRHPSSQQDTLNEPGLTRGLHRLRVILYLRANQMRILIYRPTLHSATSIMRHRTHADTAINIAKDSIRVLTAVNQTSDIYRTQQVCFNYFLISALAVLFLAVSHAPAQYSDQCRDEFYMALDLVRGFSAHSYVSKRLWRTIRGLKEVGPKLGLVARNGNENGNPQDAHNRAAVAMAGLAGHQVDEGMLIRPGSGVGTTHNGTNPDGMANDLTHLFEAAGGYAANAGANGIMGPYTMSGDGSSQHELGQGQGLQLAGSEDELTKILRELF